MDSEIDSAIGIDSAVCQSNKSVSFLNPYQLLTGEKHSLSNGFPQKNLNAFICLGTQV